jgi:hypothetical protein
MSPDLLAVAALLRCMRRHDYAGASRLVMMRETLDGLAAVAEPVLVAERWREIVTAWHAEREAERARRLEPDLRALVGLLAGLYEAPVTELTPEQASRNRSVLAGALRSAA